MSAKTIVIGGGHNGLVAAAALAKRGQDVLVLEARESLGGISGRWAFGDYAVPGILHDTRGLRHQVVQGLELEKHGLKLRDTGEAICAPQKEGPPIWLRQDSVEGCSSADQEAYRRFRAFLDRISPVVSDVLSGPAPSPEGSMWPLLKTAISVRRLGSADMVELLRVGPMCIADWMRDSFTNERLMAAIALPSIEAAYCGPWSGGTVANLLIRECTAGQEVVGGPSALIDVLRRAAEAVGAEIRTGSPVERIRLEQGRAVGVDLVGGERIDSRFLLSSCDPKQTFLGLVGEPLIPIRLSRDISNIRARGVTAKLHLGLSGPLELGDGTPVTLLRTGESLDGIERAFDAIKYRDVSSEPVLDVQTWAAGSAGLGPAGHHVVSALVHFAPYDLKGGWTDARREELTEAAISQLSIYCPSLRDRIQVSECLTPADLEREFRLTGGHLYHGEHATDQLLFMRPTVDCSGYSTPVEGLYLCGSGCHPSGGITGAPGWLAAAAVPG
jgi:phytoene dehydrogenase-like protein